jgi:D-glycerate 3-kinase
LQAPDWVSICRWRAKQEQQLFQLRGKGMTAAQLERFMQSFQRLTEHSFRVMPTSADIVIELDHQQRPTIVR